MQIQTISPQLLMLRWKTEEVTGCSPERTMHKLLILVCEGCLKAGWRPERMTELELWAEESGLIAMIFLSRREQEWFRFETLPECLNALGLLSTPPSEGLLNYEGKWFLCGRNEQCLLLTEYGQVLNDLDTAETVGLGEHVLDSSATKRLWRSLRR